MSAQLLTTELNNLITESKRKHQDLRQVKQSLIPSICISSNPVRQAAEKSLEELKSLRVSNEAQFGAGEQAFTSSTPMRPNAQNSPLKRSCLWTA